MEGGEAANHWREELRQAIDSATGAAPVFEAIDGAARGLGFEHCAFGLRLALPITRPRILTISSQPLAWQRRYREAGYVDIDPTVRHGSFSEEPQLWSDALFRETPQLWQEAQSAGLRHGWVQSRLDCSGVGSMLTLSRSAEPVTVQELRRKSAQMRHLLDVAHYILGGVLAADHAMAVSRLTRREKEVLRWTADGKTTAQIAGLLRISTSTVNFHLKNLGRKLRATTKAAMVARALALHLLD